VRGFGAFLGKELTEIVRTWRLWVIPGMLVFFGLTSPILAAITPALVQSMAASQPGVVITLPPPTAFDAYAQFIKNLDQFVLIAIVISGAGAVSGERSSGTAILALTKPLSRGAFVAAKILAQVLLAPLRHAPRRGDDALLRGVPIARCGRGGGTRVLLPRASRVELGPGRAVRVRWAAPGHARRAHGATCLGRLAGGNRRDGHRRRIARRREDLRAPGALAAR
jgi:hypothetical protein